MHLDDRLPVEPFISGTKVSNPKFSPNGEYISYIRTSDTGKALVIYDRLSNSSRDLLVDHTISTGTAYGGETYGWEPNSQYIIFAKKGELYKINVNGGVPMKIKSFDKSFHPQLDQDGLYFIIEHEDHMSLAISSFDDANELSWPKKVPVRYHFIYDPVRHNDGHYIAHVWNYPFMSWDQSKLIKLTSDGSETIIAGGNDSSVAQPRLSPDHSHLTFICEDTGWLNLWIADGDGKNARPLVDEQKEHSYTTWVSGKRNHVWLSDDRIVFTRNINGWFSLNFTDLDGNISKLDLPAGYYEDLHTDHNGNLCYLFTDHQSRTRLESISLDRDGQIKNKQIIAQNGVILDTYTDTFVEPTHINFPTRDGEEAYGLIYYPKDTGDPTPLLILVHGGPTGMFYNKFRFDPQYFVNQGWTVLGINHRGSIGYGREFRQRLMKHWGEYDVDDCVDAVDFLASQGKIDQNKVAIMGGSAGGYTTLMALARYPNVFCAGINLYGVSDLFLLAEETHYLEAHYPDQLIGELPEKSDDYFNKSPINIADQITSPLLILQGEDDQVVPQNQSELIYDKVNGIKEIKIYEDEGHGFRKTSTYKDMYSRIDSFLRKYVIYSS